jgi:hypothetical protein
MVVRMMIGGVPVQPFSMAALPPLGQPNAQLADALKQLSAAKYGRPKAEVEAEIFGRLATKAPARPSFGGGNLGTSFGSHIPATTPQWSARPGSLPTAPGGAALAPPKSASAPSFLDEWLAKRKAAASAPVSPSAVTNVPSQPSPDPAPPAASLPPAPSGELKISRGEQKSDAAGTVKIDSDGRLSTGE